MRVVNRFAVLALGMALLTGVSSPVLAEEDVCVESGIVTPAAAAQALQDGLPSGVTLGSGSAAQVLAAFSSAAHSHPGFAAEIASLIAIGRPDLVDALRGQVQSMCANNAQAILDRIALSSASPSADELAALATTGESAPAAGSAE